MNVKFFCQTPTTAGKSNVNQIIRELVSRNGCDELQVAVAYATVSGVRQLLRTFADNGLKKSEWLLGLDDYITQPGALKLVNSLPNSILRVANFGTAGLRFHPKVFKFGVLNKPTKVVGIVGSANLTSNALNKNAEAVAFFNSLKKSERGEFEDFWSELWAIGREPSKKILSKYSDKHKEVSRRRKSASKSKIKVKEKTVVEVLSTDTAEIDPALATQCWIECGNITAMGRELELKAELGLFFNLPISGGKPHFVNLHLSDGSNADFRMKYQENHMWRLQMNNTIPEVCKGLRPILKDGKMGRSPYVAVFNKIPKKNGFEVRFIKLDSRKFKKLLAITKKTGTFGRTTARQYGWTA